MKKAILLFIFFILFFPAFPAAQDEQEQLAGVLVLPFENQTQKNEYDWLSQNIPNAIVESMKEKFRFNLMTRERFEEIVVLSKAKDPVFFRAHTYETEIAKILEIVNVDIIIYGKYGYNQAKKKP